MESIQNILNSLGVAPSAAFQVEFAFRLLINLVSIYIIARKIYQFRSGNRDYMFTMFIFNVVIFIICFILNSASLSVGFAFGIFAIFSILRYRTYTVPIRDMTYMFVSIALAVLNALATANIAIVHLLFINLFIVLIVFFTDRSWITSEMKKIIRYEKIELIKPEKHDELIADLKQRTGLNVTRVDIGRIDLLRDTVLLRIFYK
ncbi:MAG: DUF4956 domain-containing protein [Candidatus Kapabacteria bacterium]|nr:DUF4956 domain-containing protein [Ignavibacteriota bacterium]MCW5885893.1 DUF4956 domain-containing protein [Candidatus Kapabacteria bacterium]